MWKLAWHKKGWREPGRGYSISVESLGIGPQGQEPEAGPDKAPGVAWLEDALDADGES